MSLMPDLDETDADYGEELVKFQAELLYKRAKWTEAAGMIGAAVVFGALSYLWSDLRGGWDHKPTWEPLVGLIVGAGLGLGVSRPFAEWLRLQARMAHVQLRMERHTRETRVSSESTARRIEDLVDAGLSGEWRVASTGGDLPSVRDDLD